MDRHYRTKKYLNLGWKLVDTNPDVRSIFLLWNVQMEGHYDKVHNIFGSFLKLCNYTKAQLEGVKV